MAQTITVNTTDIEIIRARQLAYGGSLDAKRPDSWQVYGYPDDVTFERMLTAYERGGAAHGAVHRMLDGCWQDNPRIKTEGSEDETPWEKNTLKVLKSVRGFAKLRDLDRRNMIGRYAGLILRVADSLALREPMVRAQKLVDMVPVYENQLRVTAWNVDETSEDYGKPTMYQYRTRPVQNQGDTQGRPETWIDVHPSRIIIMAEGSVGDDMFDGVPLLKAGFNALVDIEKVSGGSAESFLKNSARTITIQYDKDASPSAIGADGEKVSIKQAHESQVKALNSNQDGAIVTQGATAGVLQTTVSDPGPSFMVPANIFSASVQLPFTILFGQQTGRLASDQDKKDADARYKSRQTNEITPVIEETIRRLQGVGVIEPGAFEVEWRDISAPSDLDKLNNLKLMTGAMADVFKNGITDLFTVDELRKSVDYAPVDESQLPDMPAEGDPLDNA
jgi:hypothetical protein